MSVLRAAESSGVRWSLQREVHTEPRALYNTQVPPTRSFSSACLSLSLSLPLSLSLSLFLFLSSSRGMQFPVRVTGIQECVS